MALIPVFHVIPDEYEVDPDWTNTEAIIAGQWVALETVSGSVYATRADGSTDRVIGVSGDTMSNTTAGTAYAADVVVNSAGGTRSTQNRVSDYFNETMASGKLTVYHSGGKFHTDQYSTTVTFAAGEALYADANGDLTNADAGNAQIIGTCTQGVHAEPSGVPGTDTTDGSLSLGNYVTFILDI